MGNYWVSPPAQPSLGLVPAGIQVGEQRFAKPWRYRGDRWGSWGNSLIVREAPRVLTPPPPATRLPPYIYTSTLPQSHNFSTFPRLWWFNPSHRSTNLGPISSKLAGSLPVLSDSLSENIAHPTPMRTDRLTAKAGTVWDRYCSVNQTDYAHPVKSSG